MSLSALRSGKMVDHCAEVLASLSTYLPTKVRIMYIMCYLAPFARICLRKYHQPEKHLVLPRVRCDSLYARPSLEKMEKRKS